jgi:hypothetical protein
MTGSKYYTNLIRVIEELALCTCKLLTQKNATFTVLCTDINKNVEDFANVWVIIRVGSAKMKASDREDGFSLGSWQNVIQRWISCWKVIFWGRSAMYQSKTLAMSDVVIVTIVRGTSLDARNMSALSAGKRWSNCKRQWSMNGKKTFTVIKKGIWGA